MGNTNTQIRIEFDRPLYFTNECVTGNVHLDVAGNYSWPFSIPLHGNLPPSFHTPDESLVYTLEVTFEKPRFRQNMDLSKQIKICPHVNLQNIPNTPYTFTNHKQNANDLKINGALNTSGYIWGETIKCKLEIFNTKRLLIKNVIISIFYTCAVRPKPPNPFRRTHCTESILEKTVTSIAGTREEMISEIFDVTIPAIYMPPSFDYSRAFPNSLGRRTLNSSYTFKIVMKIEGILTDVDVTVPIIIGTLTRHFGQENQSPLITYPSPTDDTNICDDNE